METDALALIVSRPKDSFGYFVSATARFEQSKYEQALKDIEQALVLAPLETNRHIELLDLQCRTRLALGQYQRVVSDTESYLQQFPDKTIFSFHKFCAHLALGQYDQARAVFHGIAENNNQAEQELINWSMKYVFDTLAAGRNWHKPGRRPEGAPFIYMNEAEDSYTEYAAKGRRLISKGYAVDCSPDGTKLAYSSSAMGASGVALYDLRTGQSELLIVPGNYPCWSPDGQYIAFVRSRHVLDMAVLASVGHVRVYDGRLEEGPEVWVMRCDGTETRRLAFGTWPSWSPDGNDVFYRSVKENALCKIAAHDRTAQPHILLETGNGWPSVSPDGSQVAMIYSDTRLCITDLEEPAPRPVPVCDFPDLRFYGGRWSPSGRWFGLGGYDLLKRNGLWIYDMNQHRARKMLSGLESTARWSADEKSLFYFVDPPILEIWMADMESLGPSMTGKWRRITRK
jgi:hypothetical protein